MGTPHAANVVRVRRHLESETLHLPELKAMIGKDVEITVREEPAPDRWQGEGVYKDPRVSGGDACVGNTRIPVWTLVRFRQLGRTDEQLLSDFPSLIANDLKAAWAYAAAHEQEIAEAIADQERE
jgi:uncharacterized protein (DUF433 family)